MKRAGGAAALGSGAKPRRRSVPSYDIDRHRRPRVGGALIGSYRIGPPLAFRLPLATAKRSQAGTGTICLRVGLSVHPIVAEEMASRGPGTDRRLVGPWFFGSNKACYARRQISRKVVSGN